MKNNIDLIIIALILAIIGTFLVHDYNINRKVEVSVIPWRNDAQQFNLYRHE